MLGIDDAAIHGDQFRARHAGAAVLPHDVALEIAGEQRLACFCARPTEVHLLAVRRASHGDAVIAAPVAGRRRIPRGAPGVAGPADEPQPDALVPDRFPGVTARRHRLACGAPVRRRQPVPFHLVFALGEKGRVQELPYRLAVLVFDDQRDGTVLGQAERDRLEAEQLLLLDQPCPINHRQAAFHLHRELARVGEAFRPRRNFPLGLERGGAPAVVGHKGEHAVRRHAGLEDVLIESRPLVPMVKFGSSVITKRSPAFNGWTSLVSSAHGMAISCT